MTEDSSSRSKGISGFHPNLMHEATELPVEEVPPRTYYLGPDFFLAVQLPPTVQPPFPGEK